MNNDLSQNNTAPQDNAANEVQLERCRLKKEADQSRLEGLRKRAKKNRLKAHTHWLTNLQANEFAQFAKTRGWVTGSPLVASVWFENLSPEEQQRHVAGQSLPDIEPYSTAVVESQTAHPVIPKATKPRKTKRDMSQDKLPDDPNQTTWEFFMPLAENPKSECPAATLQEAQDSNTREFDVA